MITVQRPRRALISSAPSDVVVYPPISVRRGYVDAVVLFAVVFGGFVFGAAIDGAHLFGAPGPAWNHGWNPAAISIAGAALWWVRIQWDECASLRGRVGCFLMLVIAVAAVVQVRSHVLSNEVWDVGLTLACGGLCLRLARRRGLSVRQFGIAPRWAADRRGRLQAMAVAVIAFAGMCAVAAATWWITLLWPGLPVGQLRPSVSHGLVLVVHLMASSVMEELVMVAGLVTALEASRRPAWQIYAIGVAMRMCLHLYYGPIALLELIVSAVHLWLYRRTRRLTPLICVHIAFDAIASFGGQPAGFFVFLFGSLSLIYLAVAAVFITRSVPNQRAQADRSDQQGSALTAPLGPLGTVSPAARSLTWPTGDEPTGARHDGRST